MYKGFRIIFLALTILSGLPVFCSPQETISISISKEKVLIEGNKYFVHNISAGQTLYSISKAYGVSQKIIARENPGIYLGIKAGQTLFIPVIENIEKVIEEVRDTINYRYHQIESGQTLYYLSKKYETDTSDIIEHNPKTDINNLLVDSYIRIPRDKHSKTRTFNIEDDRFIYHKVTSKKESIFSLSRKYNVKVREFKEVNPGILWGLRVNEVYKIPKENMGGGQDNQVLLEELTNRLDENEILDLEFYEDLKDEKEEKTYRIVLLLPLNIATNFSDTLDINDTIPKPEIISEESEVFLEFLYGAKIAIDSLRKTNLSAEIIIKDTEGNTERVDEIFQELDLSTIDLIIGPAFSRCIEVASRYSGSYNIKLVSPLSSNNDFLQSNPNAFQVIPSESVQYDKAASYLSRYYDKNVAIILQYRSDTTYLKNINADPYLYDKHIEDSLEMENYYSQIIEYLSNNMRQEDLLYKKIYFDENEYNRLPDDTLSLHIEDVLSLGMDNLVVILSKDEVFATDLITKLNIVSDKYKIHLFGMPDWLSRMDIDVEYLFNLNLQYYTNFRSSFVDYSLPSTIRFLELYRNKHLLEPTNFSMQGYDVMFYFLNALHWFGKDFEKALPYIDYILSKSSLQNRYNFKRLNSRGGFENYSVSIIEYNKEEFKRRLIPITDSQEIFRRSRRNY